MRTYLNSCFALLVSGLLPLSAHAQEKGLYVVDVQRVVTESELGKKAKANVEAQVKKEEASLKKMEIDLKALRGDIEKQRAILSGAALEKKADELRKKERDLKNEFEDRRNALVKKNQAEVGRVVSEVDKVIKELAEKEGYRFILEKDPRVVVYAGPSLDVTEKVIKLLNSKKI
jgi:outer membrane protein